MKSNRIDENKKLLVKAASQLNNSHAFQDPGALNRKAIRLAAVMTQDAKKLDLKMKTAAQKIIVRIQHKNAVMSENLTEETLEMAAVIKEGEQLVNKLDKAIIKIQKLSFSQVVELFRNSLDLSRRANRFYHNL